MTYEMLADELGVTARTVRKYMTMTNISVEKVVGICVALEVPVYISLKLIEQSGNALVYDDSHHLYREFLLQTGRLKVSRCEAILAAKGMKPLFRRAG